MSEHLPSNHLRGSCRGLRKANQHFRLEVVPFPKSLADLLRLVAAYHVLFGLCCHHTILETENRNVINEALENCTLRKSTAINLPSNCLNFFVAKSLALPAADLK